MWQIGIDILLGERLAIRLLQRHNTNMKIYTRGGDQGETGLFGGPRVGKAHLRVEAYGAVDELCALLAWAGLTVPAASPEDPEGWPALAEVLERECGRLFTLGAHLATPPEANDAARAHLPAWPENSCAQLEAEIDAWQGALPALRTFILPGGSEGAARLHLARAVCRRAERAVVALAASETIAAEHLAYLNRLSDWLFAAARAANHLVGSPDQAWTPN